MKKRVESHKLSDNGGILARRQIETLNALCEGIPEKDHAAAKVFLMTAMAHQQMAEKRISIRMILPILTRYLHQGQIKATPVELVNTFITWMASNDPAAVMGTEGADPEAEYMAELVVEFRTKHPRLFA